MDPNEKQDGFDPIREMDRIARTMGMRVREITEAEFVATLTTTTNQNEGPS